VRVDVVSGWDGGRVARKLRDTEYWLPTMFTASVTGDDLAHDLVVTLGVNDDSGVVSVSRLEVLQREGGPPITSTTLGRLPLASIRDRAASAAAKLFPLDPEQVEIVQSTVGPHARDMLGHALTSRPLGRKGSPVIREDELERVASVARDAGKSRIQAVREEWGVSRATAWRAIDAARKAGHDVGDGEG
jgi:hypothetical protein